MVLFVCIFILVKQLIEEYVERSRDEYTNNIWVVYKYVDLDMFNRIAE